MSEVITTPPAMEEVAVVEGVVEESTPEVVSEEVAAPAAVTEEQPMETEEVTTEEAAVAEPVETEAEPVETEAEPVADAEPTAAATEVKIDEEKVPGALIKASGDNELKLFVGGLSFNTDLDGLTKYFEVYGKVTDCVIKKDRNTGRSRGFGFVLFEVIDSVEKVLAVKEHSLNGRKIEPKRAQVQRKDNKMFVGALKPETDDETIKTYFATYGEIESFERPIDKSTGLKRGFCFILYKKDGILVDCCSKKDHEIDGKVLDVKEARPPTKKPPMMMGGGGGYMPPQNGGYYGTGFGMGGGYGGGMQGGYYGGHPGYGGGQYNQYNQYGGFQHYGGRGGGKMNRGRGGKKFGPY